MMNSPLDYCPADSATDDLSEFELQEIAEDVIRDLREEGLLRPTPVSPAGQDTQSDSPGSTPLVPSQFEIDGFVVSPSGGRLRQRTIPAEAPATNTSHQIQRDWVLDWPEPF
jgi:hypothetical protein